MQDAKTNVIHSTTRTFDQDVLESSIPVVVDFYADWCGPCRMLAPHLERLAGEFAGKVKVVKVDVDEHGELAARYGISGIPTMIFFKGGTDVDTAVGLLPPAVIREKLERLTAAPPPVRS